MTEPDHINYIDFEMMEKMCHPIAVALFDSMSEPIAKFHEHERALLESALGNPQQSFDGKDLYRTFVQKAAILYYGLIKNHAFKNGNKRTATATLLTFLHINDFELTGTKQEIEDYLVTLAKRVASTEGTTDKDKWLSEIENWLEDHITSSI
jgi:death on curing protein